MKVSFIYLTSNQNGDEHLGTASIAAFLEENNISVELKIITYLPEQVNVENILNKIPEDIDLIGFPVYNTNILYVYKICDALKLKNPNIITSVGGPLATDAGDLILKDCSSIDFAVLGDGEIPFLTVIQEIQKGGEINRIPWILTRDNNNLNEKQINITDVNSIPWVSRQYLEQMLERGYGTARISAARGCCANCSFCSHNNYIKGKNKRWRGRDIKDVFNEVVFIHQKYNIMSFTFNDGSFEDPGEKGKQRIRQFCEMVLSYPHKLHFWCFLRADTFKEKDIPLMELMKKAGFTEVFIGIESQNATDLKFYNKRATIQDNINSLQYFQQCGINVLFGFINFNPITSIESLKDNYKFLREVKNWRPHAYVGRLSIYYNTAIHRKCEALGLLTDDFSYYNADGYRFADSQVAEIWAFIEKHVLNSIVFTKYDFDLFYFNNYIHSFLALFPDKISMYLTEYKNIMEEIATILSDYFYHLFYTKDIDYAQKNIKCFEEDMAKAILNMNSLKLKIMLREPFRSYVKGVAHKSRRQNEGRP